MTPDKVWHFFIGLLLCTSMCTIWFFSGKDRGERAGRQQVCNSVYRKELKQDKDSFTRWDISKKTCVLFEQKK